MPNKRKLQDINFDRVYVNHAEQAFAERARERGWFVTKRGYPDFICYRGDDIMLVEVKTGNRRLKTPQAKLMNYLSSRGIKCYKWTIDKDFFSKNTKQA